MDTIALGHRILGEVRRKRWDCLPEEFRRHRQVNNRFGRIGIEFGEWIPVSKPGLLAGLLHDGDEHRVDLLPDPLGLNLIFTIDVGNTRKSVPLAILHSCGQALADAIPTASVLYGHERKNKKQDIIVLEPFCTSVTAPIDEQQIASNVYDRFHQWCSILFRDGSLARALADGWHDNSRGSATL